MGDDDINDIDGELQQQHIKEGEVEEEDDEQEITITNNLLGKLSIETIIEFDNSIANLFNIVFYSFSHDFVQQTNGSDVAGGSGGEGGIVTHFLRNWKETVGVSGISKTLPAIITGSIVEGACLSRLFHPSVVKSMKLEADIMYLVGCIDETTAKESFEDIGKPGFLKIKYSPDIQIFVQDKTVSIKDIVVDDVDNEQIPNASPPKTQYINGLKLKIMHQNLQSHNQRLQFGDTPYIVTIQQKISGPSSEIVFKSKQFSEQKQRDKVAAFLEILAFKVESLSNNFLLEMESLLELQTIMKSSLSALVDVENERALFPKDDQALTSEETLQLKSQIDKKEKGFKMLVEDLFKSYKLTSYDFLRNVTLLCFDKQDAYFNETYAMFVELPMEIPQTFNETMEESIKENFAFFSDNGILGELMELSFRVEKSPIMMLKSFSIRLPVLKEKLKEMLSNRAKFVRSGSPKDSGVQEVDKISFDNVSCFYCSFWPDIAAEWITRKRKWPPEENVKRIVKSGTYIVAKQSESGMDHILEWRWSFSSAEIALANLRSSKMKYCYFVFKSLFYRYFKDLESSEKSLPSYVAKTCMLHLSEQNKERWWEMQSVAKCVIRLFEYLQKSLREEFLQHFFIESLNLLADIAEELIQRALSIVSDILRQPVEFIQFEDDKMNIIKQIRSEVIYLHELDTTKSEDPNADAIDQPPLITTLRQRYEYVTKLYENRVNLKIDLKRYTWLQEYYRLLWQEKMYKKNIDIYEMFLSSKDPSDPEYKLIKKTCLDVSKEILEQIMKQIYSVRQTVSLHLKHIVDLTRQFCIKCDVCLQLVPCQTDRYCCRDITTKCNYDICLSCYGNLMANTPVGDVHVSVGSSQHEHPLTMTSECSPYCFTQFTHERLGCDDWYKAMMDFSDARWKTGNKVIASCSILGFQDKALCTLFFDQGVVMKQELVNLFDSLGLQDHKVPSNHTDDGSDGKNLGINTLNGGDPLDTIEICQNSPDDDIREIEEFMRAVTKRNLILKLVYPEE